MSSLAPQILQLLFFIDNARLNRLQVFYLML